MRRSWQQLSSQLNTHNVYVSELIDIGSSNKSWSRAYLGDQLTVEDNIPYCRYPPLFTYLSQFNMEAIKALIVDEIVFS